MTELVEWACRTYGWRVDYVTYEIPLCQLALVYRCFVQGVGGVKSSTLLEMESGRELFANGKFKEILAAAKAEAEAEEKRRAEAEAVAAKNKKGVWKL